MPTNQYFNQYFNVGEQNLLRDLVAEATQITGLECYYVPRRLGNYDSIYGADDMSIYDSAYPIECYIESIMGFDSSNMKELYTKFAGIEIRDQITLSIPATAIDNLVDRFELGKVRPLETDIIYFPFNKRCFMIKSVDNKPFFYPLGILPSYKLICEVFEYSSERFQTGISEIDILNKYSEDEITVAIQDQNGVNLVDENQSLIININDESQIDNQDDSDEINKESSQWLDFSEIDPFSERGST